MSIATKSCLPLARQTLVPLSPDKANYYDPGYGAFVPLGMGYPELKTLLFEQREFTVTLYVSCGTDTRYTITADEDYPNAIGSGASVSGGLDQAIPIFCRLLPDQRCFSLVDTPGPALHAAIQASRVAHNFRYDAPNAPLPFETAYQRNATDFKYTQSSVLLSFGGDFYVGKRHGHPWGAFCFRASAEFQLNDPGYIIGAYEPNAYLVGTSLSFVFSGSSDAWVHRGVSAPHREVPPIVGDEYGQITVASGHTSLPLPSGPQSPRQLRLKTQTLNFEAAAKDYDDLPSIAWTGAGSTKIGFTNISIDPS